MIALGKQKQPVFVSQRQAFELPACPACTGRLVEVRGQLRCSRCHTLCEDACDGSPDWPVRADDVIDCDS